MGAPRRDTKSQEPCKQYGHRRSDISPRVMKLKRRFADFRQKHPLRARIPEDLRLATLNAISNGASESEVRRACGVTSDQLQYWRKQQDRIARDSQALTPPRAFPVVHDVTEMAMLQDGDQGQQALELRLGAWAISIKHIDG